jgi:hypothetical protein
MTSKSNMGPGPTLKPIGGTKKTVVNGKVQDPGDPSARPPSQPKTGKPSPSSY